MLPEAWLIASVAFLRRRVDEENVGGAGGLVDECGAATLAFDDELPAIRLAGDRALRLDRRIVSLVERQVVLAGVAAVDGIAGGERGLATLGDPTVFGVVGDWI